MCKVLHAQSTSFSVIFKMTKSPFLLFQISLFLVPIVNLNRIRWNPTLSINSLIARISLFDSFKFTRTRVLEKLVKKLMKKIL